MQHPPVVGAVHGADGPLLSAGGRLGIMEAVGVSRVGVIALLVLKYACEGTFEGLCKRGVRLKFGTGTLDELACNL